MPTRFARHQLNKAIRCLLVTAVILAAARECRGATAELSHQEQLSHIWQQEFSVPTDTRSAVPSNPNSNTLHLSSSQPHPAVARIIVPENGATSYGSGTLVDSRDQFGLVITNWHVVRDAKEMVEVVFPGGFTSKARALKVDPDWDLAALVIWRPPVEPVSIASVAPKPGDQLTICGYGQGMYRSATGHCTQYYAPRLDFPRHMVELDVEARQGDSGGPIFNRHGELAGVLFGAGQGTTLGSFGGRVDSFLASLAPDIGQPENCQPEGQLATNLSPPCDRGAPCCQDGSCAPPQNIQPPVQTARLEQTPSSAATAESDQWQASQHPPDDLAAMWPEEPASAETEAPAEEPEAEAIATAHLQSVSRDGTFEQMKTVLAAIGLLSLAVLILRAAR